MIFHANFFFPLWEGTFPLWEGTAFTLSPGLAVENVLLYFSHSCNFPSDFSLWSKSYLSSNILLSSQRVLISDHFILLFLILLVHVHRINSIKVLFFLNILRHYFGPRKWLILWMICEHVNKNNYLFKECKIWFIPIKQHLFNLLFNSLM